MRIISIGSPGHLSVHTDHFHWLPGPPERVYGIISIGSPGHLSVHTESYFAFSHHMINNYSIARSCQYMARSELR
jgi:hypothetical protein